MGKPEKTGWGGKWQNDVRFIKVGENSECIYESTKQLFILPGHTWFILCCCIFKNFCMKSQGYCADGDGIMYSEDDLLEVPTFEYLNKKILSFHYQHKNSKIIPFNIQTKY